MASEIRVNQIQSRTGVSTVSFTDSGPIFAGISTVQGPLTVDGGVTGNVTGDVTGNVTGNVTGDVTSSGTSTFDVISGVSTIGVTTVHLTGINDLNYPTTGSLSNRNLIVNGAMKISQRGTNFTNVTGDLIYHVDRFKLHNYTPGSGVLTISQSTDSPDGFQNSLKLQCTTAQSTLDANSQMSIYQVLEGLDTSHLEYYVSNPDTVTFSFYVKSNRTGSFSAQLKLSDNNSSWGNVNTRVYPFNYSISSADTWEYKTKTITLDTYSGTKVTTNGFAVSIQWYQNAGASRQGLNNDAWRGNANASSGADNLNIFSSTDNYWAITGVQMETGSVATPFEHKSYGDELLKCQRYYETGNWHGMYKTSDDTMGWVNYKVTKRSNPSVTSIAPGGTTTNRVYYYSTDPADRGVRTLNQINTTSWVGGMTDFTNSFFGVIANFTPASSNDAVISGIYRADAEL